MPELLTVIKVVIMFLIGLIFIFEGYNLERIVITIIWFLLGFGIARDILELFNYSTGIVPLVIETIVGLCFASVGYKIERLALFIAIGYAVFIAIPSYLTISNQVVFFVVRIFLAIFIALLAHRFRVLLYALIVSLLGATIIKQAILILFPNITGGLMTAANIFVIVLVVIGLISQLEEHRRVTFN